MKRLVVLGCALLALAGCSPPPKEVCNDYRWMTYYDGNPGSDDWDGPKTKYVCVVNEKKVPALNSRSSGEQ